MNIRKIDHQHIILAKLLLLYLGNRLFHTFQCQFLTAVVHCFEIPRNTGCFGLILCLKKRKRMICRVKTPGCIQARSQNKSNRVRFDMPCICSRRTYQRFQSDIPRMFHQIQTFTDYDTVLIPKLHHIPNRSKSRKFQQFQSHIGLHHLLPGHTLALRRQCQYQLIRHYCAAYFRKWVVTILLLGIYYCCRRRDQILPLCVLLFIRDFMMICHHDCHPQ